MIFDTCGSWGCHMVNYIHDNHEYNMYLDMSMWYCCEYGRAKSVLVSFILLFFFVPVYYLINVVFREMEITPVIMIRDVNPVVKKEHVSDSLEWHGIAKQFWFRLGWLITLGA